MAVVKVNRRMRAFWRFHRWLYARSGGRIGTRIGKQQLLRLITVGRNTQLPRAL